MSGIRKYIALLLLCLLPTSAIAAGQESAGSGADPFSDAEKAAIGELIRNYILENPEILPEAIGILQEREQETQKLAMRDAVKANRARIEQDGVSPVAGNPDGDVTIAEFYDYQCPYCRRGHKDVLRLIAEDPNLRVVYKQFPVKDAPGEEPGSMVAARMAIAADRQGKFMAFHQAAMATPMPLSEVNLFAAARNAGLDPIQLSKDMKDGTITDSIRSNMFLARELGINGTPTYIIGDELVIGAHGYDTLKKVIAETRAAKNK